MVDTESLLIHLRELKEAYKDLSRYRQEVTLQDLKESRDKRNMVLHALLVSIQAALDIANHLIVEEGLSRPESYREAFTILQENGLLPAPLGEKLAELAGFRNVLVHLYFRLDLEEVFHILQEDIGALKDFVSIVAKILNPPEDQEKKP